MPWYLESYSRKNEFIVAEERISPDEVGTLCEMLGVTVSDAEEGEYRLDRVDILAFLRSHGRTIPPDVDLFLSRRAD